MFVRAAAPARKIDRVGLPDTIGNAAALDVADGTASRELRRRLREEHGQTQLLGGALLARERAAVGRVERASGDAAAALSTTALGSREPRGPGSARFCGGRGWRRNAPCRAAASGRARADALGRRSIGLTDSLARTAIGTLTRVHSPRRLTAGLRGCVAGARRVRAIAQAKLRAWLVYAIARARIARLARALG